MADLDTPSIASEPPGPARSDEPRRQRRAFWTELPFLVLVAIVLAILLKTFVVQAFYIPSTSMEPTLVVNDRVLVSKLSHELREPVRGEVVVFRLSGDTSLAQDAAAAQEGWVERSFGALVDGLGFGTTSDTDYIKRIIGLPGETIEVRGGVVHIDGEPLDEDVVPEGYLSPREDLRDFPPVVVEDEHYFMMGDNRINSSDSRLSLGQVPREAILGRAFVTIWPLSNAGMLEIGDYEQDS